MSLGRWQSVHMYIQVRHVGDNTFSVHMQRGELRVTVMTALKSKYNKTEKYNIQKCCYFCDSFHFADLPYILTYTHYTYNIHIIYIHKHIHTHTYTYMYTLK